MKKLWINKNITYNGSQLHSHFAYLNYRILGNSIISWAGSCKLTSQYIVDGEDLINNCKIEADKMLHFIIEIFPQNFFYIVSIQRLFCCLIMEFLQKNIKEEIHLKNLIRKGDDIYIKNKKLSISIATVSPCSSLIHFGINILNKGTPVPTISLDCLNINYKKLSLEIMNKFILEIESITKCTQKSKWVC